MIFLAAEYPGLYYLVCKTRKLTSDNYRKACQQIEVEQSPNLVVYHILGYLVPYFAELKQSGRVKLGSKKIKVDGMTCQFSGYVDAQTGTTYGTG